MKILTQYGVKLVKEVSKKYELPTKSASSSAESARIIETVLNLSDSTVEKFGILCLDSANTVIGIHLVGVGDTNQCVVDLKGIFQRIILNNATKFIAFHNHPAGCQESQADKNLNERLVKASEIMGIQYLDHIIIQDEKSYLSFREKGLM